MMSARRGCSPGRDRPLSHAWDVLCHGSADENYFMSRIGRQGSGKMAELAGRELVHEEYSHLLRCPERLGITD